MATRPLPKRVSRVRQARTGDGDPPPGRGWGWPPSGSAPAGTSGDRPRPVRPRPGRRAFPDCASPAGSPCGWARSTPGGVPGPIIRRFGSITPRACRCRSSPRPAPGGGSAIRMVWRRGWSARRWMAVALSRRSARRRFPSSADPGPTGRRRACSRPMPSRGSITARRDGARCGSLASRAGRARVCSGASPAGRNAVEKRRAAVLTALDERSDDDPI